VVMNMCINTIGIANGNAAPSPPVAHVVLLLLIYVSLSELYLHQNLRLEAGFGGWWRAEVE
jgi:hypothetical protein